MKRDEILMTIKGLARCQGFYGRLLQSLMELPKADFDKVMDELEAQNFKDSLDLVYFFEC